MAEENVSFTAADGKKLPAKYRKLARAMRIFEAVFFLLIMAVLAMMIFMADFSFWDFPMIVLWIALLILFSGSWNWSYRLGWNQRLNRRMRYVLEEDGLSVFFNRKKLAHFPYSAIKGTEILNEPLTKIKHIHLFGSKYWVTPGLGSGTCREYPTIMVYATSLEEGIVIHARFETILVTPEQEDKFISSLGERIDSSKMPSENAGSRG